MGMQREGLRRPVLAALAALAWFGVGLQLWLSIRLADRAGQSFGQGLLAYFSYFTVLTNILVASTASVGWVASPARRGGGLGSDSMRGCATTAIVLVGIAYHLLLRHIWDPQGWQWVADVTLHYAVPLAALACWVAFPPRERLPVWAPLAWCAYPVAYFVYALVRGALIGTYPYPFIDVGQLGYARALANALGLLAGFVVLGFAVRAIAAVRSRAAAARA